MSSTHPMQLRARKAVVANNNAENVASRSSRKLVPEPAPFVPPEPTPPTAEELRLKKIVDRRRDKRRQINQQFADRTGYAKTLNNFDREKRIAEQAEELCDENIGKMLQKVREIRDSFVKKLQKRDRDIAAGRVDPDEATGKEFARKMKRWLSAVPTLFAMYDDNDKDDRRNDSDLNKLTTVFNYVDAGNNEGADGAVPAEPIALPEHDFDSDSDMSADDEAPELPAVDSDFEDGSDNDGNDIADDNDGNVQLPAEEDE